MFQSSWTLIIRFTSGMEGCWVSRSDASAVRLAKHSVNLAKICYYRPINWILGNIGPLGYTGETHCNHGIYMYKLCSQYPHCISIVK